MLAELRDVRWHGRPGAYQSIGFGQAADADFLPGFVTGGLTGDIKLTTTYGFRGGYNHNWDPYWSVGLCGSWAAVRYNGNAKGLSAREVGGTFKGWALSSRRVAGCNPDFNNAQLSA